MFKKVLFALAVPATLLITGCSTVQQQTVQPTPTYSSSAPAMAAKQEIRVSEEVQKLTVSVSAASMDSVTSTVKDRIEGLMARSGFTIKNTTPDVLVYFKTSMEHVDTLGNYQKWRGDADVSVNRTYDRKLIGKKTFEAAPVRDLSADTIRKKIGADLGGQIEQWLYTKCSTERIGIKSVNLNFNLKQTGREASNMASDFVSTIKRMDGVIDCKLTSMQLTSGKFTINVVYYQENLPAGVLLEFIKTSPQDIKVVE